MTSVLVVYGSTTGKTETAAHLVSDALSRAHDTTVKRVSDTSIRDIGKYDLVVFGCATWGEGEGELQDDFHEFFLHLDNAPLTARKVAIFGCGDRSYPNFCGAVDVIESKMRANGAKIISDSLRIDGEPDISRDAIMRWAEALG